jgi:hypothetical protein
MDDAIILQRLDGLELLVAWHFWIDAVELPKLDLLEPKPFPAPDSLLPQVFRAAIPLPGTSPGSPQSTFCGNEHGVIGIENFADELLGDSGP